MAEISIDSTCPHCLKENAYMHFIKQASLEPYKHSLVFQCQACFKLMVAEILSNETGGPLVLAQHSTYPIVVNKHDRTGVIATYPEVKSYDAPSSTPERASKFFIEAKEDFARGRFETSAMNCRKVIDIATKELHLGDEDKLVRRITALRATGLITQEMADWAHIVRIDTNGAIHSDEEFTKEDVDQLLKFTEVFLTYAFTLPAMVKDKREAT